MKICTRFLRQRTLFRIKFINDYWVCIQHISSRLAKRTLITPLKESALLLSVSLCKDNQNRVKLFQRSVAVCTNPWHCGSSTEQERKRDTRTHSQRQRQFVCQCVINCQEELLAAWGSGPNSAVLASLVSRQSTTTRMGEHSLTMYGLQGFSLKIWLNFHPGC